MGADLILTACAIKQGQVPDWQSGEKFLEELVIDDDLLEELDCSGMYIEQYENDEDAMVDIRERLGSALDEFQAAYEMGDRSTVYFPFGEWQLIICGGTSWGDTPSECFDAINFLEAAGVMKAMGFIWPVEPTTESDEW